MFGQKQVVSTDDKVNMSLGKKTSLTWMYLLHE